MHARVFIVTSLNVLEGAERHQAAIGAFDNLQGRIITHRALADAEVGVVAEVAGHA